MILVMNQLESFEWNELTLSEWNKKMFADEFLIAANKWQMKNWHTHPTLFADVSFRT